ncbi:MAG: YggT family protein [Dehalococcoidia bacterium]|nr:YggT family protein [Dehalococcoidia bacterium]
MAAILLRVILSWVSLAFSIDPRNPFVAALHEITEPILAPLRSVLPSFGMMDFSPFVAMILLEFIAQAAQRALT